MRAAAFPVPRGVWIILALTVLVLAVPVWGLLPEVTADSPRWERLAPRLFRLYVKDTLILTLAAGSLAMVTGTAAAWLTSACRFPGQRMFSWALVLPMALPGYIAVYGYDFVRASATNWLQVWLREAAGTETASLVDEYLRYVILSGILGMVLYPYVYLTARASFRRQAASVIEASRLLGRSATVTFFRIALPLARPAIAAGALLVVMEVLNDYGAVQFFGLKTLTTGVFIERSKDENASAVRIALLLLGLVMVFLWIERLARSRARYHEGAAHRPLTPWQLTGVKAWLACAACALPLILGFLLPAARLMWLAWKGAPEVIRPEFWQTLANSVALAGGSAAAIACAALLVAYAVRLQRGWAGTLMSRAALLGYGMPGMVIALGVTLGLARLSHALDIDMLTGTLAGLGMAYMVRFLAVSYQPLEGGLQRVCASLDDASRSLGAGPWRTLWRVNLPLLRGPLFAALLLTFIDILKELPITLVLRPANFNTLATRTWDLSEQSRMPEACVPAMFIVALSAAGALWLQRRA